MQETFCHMIDYVRATTMARDAVEGMGIFFNLRFLLEGGARKRQSRWRARSKLVFKGKTLCEVSMQNIFLLIGWGSIFRRRRTISMVPALFHSERHGAVSERASQKNISVIHVRSAL